MNPIMLDLGIIAIRWYSFFIFLGLLIGGVMAINEGKKWNISEDFLINYAFYLIPISIIGARLYYVFFNYDYYSVYKEQIFQIWNGGLAIHGALLFGLIFTLIYTKKYKVDILRLTDILVVSLFIGQAIGRFGNFMNSEAHGPATTLEFLQSLRIPNFIINGMNIGGVYYHPTFLYESVFCIIGFIGLLIFRRLKYTKIGQTTAIYLIWYGICRFFIEGLRTDSLLLNNLKVARIVSIIMIISGIILYIYQGRGSKFERQYNDINNTSKDNF